MMWLWTLLVRQNPLLRAFQILINFSFSPSARWCIGICCEPAPPKVSGGRQMASPDNKIPCRISSPGLIVEQYTRVISPSPATYTSVIKHVATLPTLLSRKYPLDIPSFLGEYLDLDIKKISNWWRSCRAPIGKTETLHLCNTVNPVNREKLVCGI